MTMEHSDPFDQVTEARPIVTRLVVDWLVLVGSLTVIGLLLTRFGGFDGVVEWDERLSAEIADSRSDGWVDFAKFMTSTGDTMPILLLMGLITAVLALLRKWRAMTFVPMAMLVEITTFLSVNYLVRRERPDVEKLGPLPGTFSYPSGHIAATFVIWVGVSVLLMAYGQRRAAQVVAVFGSAMALAMGWARVYVGMHHTIDVILGLVMGISALAIAIRVLRVQVP